MLLCAYLRVEKDMPAVPPLIPSKCHSFNYLFPRVFAQPPSLCFTARNLDACLCGEQHFQISSPNKSFYTSDPTFVFFSLTSLSEKKLSFPTWMFLHRFLQDYSSWITGSLSEILFYILAPQEFSSRTIRVDDEEPGEPAKQLRLY